MKYCVTVSLFRSVQKQIKTTIHQHALMNPMAISLKCIDGWVETHYNMQNCYPLTAVGLYFQVFSARCP